MPAAGDPVTQHDRWAVDTSVAVPLLVERHPAHGAVWRWVADRSATVVLCGHALPETYSVLTRLPGDARVAGSDAVRLIDDVFDVEAGLPQELTATLHRRMAGAQIAGGAVYDAMVALAARHHGLSLATRDVRAKGTYEALGVAVEVVA